MNFSQTPEPANATTFQSVVAARDIGLTAAGKWQLHFMICNAEPPAKGFIVRLANGQYLKADK